MRKFFYVRGVKTALHDLGLQKELYTSANREPGRLGIRTIENPEHQISSAFSEHDRQFDTATSDASTTTPVSSYQSKAANFDIKKLHEASPVPVMKHHLAERHGGGFYDSQGMFQPSGEPYIGVSQKPNAKDSSILAHEIGHAQFQESPLGKIVQNPVSRILPLAGLPASGLIGRSPLKGKTKALAIGATILGSNAPTLTSEGVASYKGYQLLKNLGASDEQLQQYVKDIALPQASYLLTPAISGLLGYLGHRSLGPKKDPTGPHTGNVYDIFTGTKLGNFKLEGRVKFRGLDISIENNTGSTRTWHDPHTGKDGKTLMRYPYGYIRMTEGMDGDHVDCFVGPNEQAENVYVITTSKPPDFKVMDEQKCMLGFSSEQAARAAFHTHYDDPRFLREIKTLSFEDFKKKVLGTRTTTNKKLATNLSEYDLQHPISHGLGPSRTSVPGDFLGFPLTAPRMKHILGGHPETPSDTIDRQFRSMDQEMDTDVLEGNTAALPESPGV